MNLVLVRCRESEYGTFGRLFIDDVFECFTLEPCSKGEHPCIPYGSYCLTLNIVSPRFVNRYPYNTLCHGKLPRLIGVPGRDGILIHIGNFLKDTKGCILVGERASLTRLYNSTNAFIHLYKKMTSVKFITLSVLSATSLGRNDLMA